VLIDRVIELSSLVGTHFLRKDERMGYGRRNVVHRQIKDSRETRII